MSEQNSGELYDMSEHFKTEHDKLTKDIDHKDKQIKFYKKNIMFNYSLIKLLDETFHDMELDKVFYLQSIIDVLRTKNSDLIDRLIFNRECPVCCHDDSDDED